MKSIHIFSGISALMIDTLTWFYPLLLISLAGLIESWLIFNLFPEATPTALGISFPILYLGWLLVFLCLSTIGTKLLFLLGDKPESVEINVLEDPLLLFRFSPIIISYRVATFMFSLPLMRYLQILPTAFKSLEILGQRAYSPAVHIGKNSLLVSWSQDPDLTYIGNNVVIGAGCEIACHALNAVGGKLQYSSDIVEIADNVTIGGNTRIGMGVKIGRGAVVEMGSNVLPYTRIGAREVWGGNPAQFLRRSERNADVSVESRVSPLSRSSEFDKQLTPNSVSDFSGLDALIAKALRIKPEEVTDDLSSDNFSEWDSLAKMAIAAAIFDRFEVRIPPTEIFHLDSRQSIKQLIANYSEPKSATETPPGIQPVLPTNPELLPLYDFAEVTRSLTKQLNQPLPVTDKTINIVATFTAQPLGSTLELWCRAFGLSSAVNFLEFNQVEQTLLSDSSPFITNHLGINAVLVRPEDLITDHDPTGMIRATDILNAAQQFSTHRSGLVVSNLPPAVSSFLGSNAAQVDKLRAWWQTQLEQIKGIRVLDFASIVEEVGRVRARDTSLEVIARAPYSQELYQHLGIAIARLVRQTFLPPKKVIALDCDNTLWGGVIGEDGLHGLQLSDDHPGRSFRLFQKALLDLSKSGSLLVLVSKNEEADVWQVFDQHSEMLLKREHIVSTRINWQPKSANLRAIAQELNLGLDSFVFIDDSPTERLEVETNLPEVTVFPLPNNPTQYAELLSKLWCFDALNVTSEDQQRTEYMLREQQRQSLKQESTGLEDYLQSLKLEVRIRFAEEKDLSRVAQLTQKTNQFNLSLIRRSLAEIQAIQSQSSILTLTVQDRFGDYGLVGVAILRPKKQQLRLDTFLMSCRVLGRGVEDAFLAGIFEFAARQGLDEILAPYSPGARNAQMQAFLLRMGFQQKLQNSFTAKVQDAPGYPKHIAIQSQI